MTILRFQLKEFPPGIPLLPVHARFPEHTF